MHTRRSMLLAPLLFAGTLVGCAVTPNPLSLTPSQQSAVAQAQDYLNTLASFQARFVQTGWSGSGAGFVWVDRPGRLRLTYLGPAARDMVADEGMLIIYDHANGAVTTMPVAKTPLGLLLAPHISLTGTVAVTGFTETAATLSLTLQDTANPAQGTLTVTLQKTPLLLTGVTATDIHGRSLSLALSQLDLHPVLTPQLFASPAPPTS